jgi:RNA recognition motif-containing protein
MQIVQTATAPAIRSTKKLLIGNLPERPGKAAAAIIEDLFSPVGKVLSVSVLNHGFAFVEMKTADADRALVQLKGCRIDGKAMMLDEAHPRRPSR